MPLRSEDMPGPDHVEQMTAAPGETRDVIAPDHDDWVEVWETEPPAPGVRFKVVEQQWNADYSVRRIRAIEIV